MPSSVTLSALYWPFFGDKQDNMQSGNGLCNLNSSFGLRIKFDRLVTPTDHALSRHVLWKQCRHTYEGPNKADATVFVCLNILYHIPVSIRFAPKGLLILMKITSMATGLANSPFII